MKARHRNASVQIGRILLGLLVLSSCSSCVPAEQWDEAPQAGIRQPEVEIVATVNGEPITLDEYRLAGRLSASQTGQQGGRTADELETAIRVKVLQLEGVQQGLLASASFTDFHARLDQENERRAQAIEQNAVIYGPKRYSEQTFYTDEFGQLENELKRMAVQTMNMSEEVLQQAYQRDLAAYAIQPTIRFKVWTLPISPDAGSDFKRMQTLHQEAVSGANIDEIVHQANQAEAMPIKVTDETLNEANKRSFLKYRESLLEQVNRLQPGEFSTILNDQGNYVMMYCESREEHGVKPFAEVRDEVYRKHADEQFQAYWNRLRAEATVQVKASEHGARGSD